MASITTAYAALKSRAALITSVPVFWAKENNVLPDPPNPFILFEVEVELGQIAGFGGGRGDNLYRYSAELLGWLAVEQGRGIEYGAPLAESIAAVFRSFRDDFISCFDSTAQPVTDITENTPRNIEASNYDWYLIVTRLHFDQIG